MRESAAPQPGNRRHWVAVVGVLLAVVLGVLVWQRIEAHGSDDATSGLLLKDGALATDGQDIEGHPLRTGTRAAYAGATIFNTGSAPVTLISAKLYPPVSGLVQEKSWVVAPGRKMNAVEFQPWPNFTDPLFRLSMKRAEPVKGFVLQPWHPPSQQGAELVIILRATRTGNLATPYVYVRYRVGSAQYGELLPRGVVLCARPHLNLNLNCQARLDDQKVASGSVLQ